MSEISQLKTVNGEYSGLADSALRDVSGTFLTAVPEGYATTADITGKQDKLTFGYNASNAISSINNSALAGEGGGGGTSYTFTAPLYDNNGTVSLSTRYGSFSSYQTSANFHFNVEIKSLNGESSYGYGLQFSRMTNYPATINVWIFPDSSFTAAAGGKYIYPLIMNDIPAEFVFPENIWYIPQRIYFGEQIDPPYAYIINDDINVITQSGRSDSPIRLEGENDFTNYPYFAFGVFSEENPTSTASLIGIYGANSATLCTGLIGQKYLDIELDSRFNKNNDGVITGYQGSGIGGTFDNTYNTIDINGIPTILTNGTGTKSVPLNLHSEYSAEMRQRGYTGYTYNISAVTTSACLSHNVPYDITARFLTGGPNPAFTAKLRNGIDNIVTGMEPNYGYYVDLTYSNQIDADYIMNVSSELVNSVELSGIVIPDTSDFVPNSSYTAATAELNELKNIISTYSGQWVSP